MSDECVFCGIVRGTQPGSIVKSSATLLMSYISDGLRRDEANH
jgi:hypothetical protein